MATMNSNSICVCLLFIVTATLSWIVCPLVKTKVNICGSVSVIVPVVQTVTVNNNVSCNALGRSLGYSQGDMDEFVNLEEFVEKWVNDGYTSHHAPLATVIREKQYRVMEEEMNQIQAFETCRMWLHHVASAILYVPVVALFVLIVVLYRSSSKCCWFDPSSRYRTSPAYLQTRPIGQQLDVESGPSVSFADLPSVVTLGTPTDCRSRERLRNREEKTTHFLCFHNNKSKRKGKRGSDGKDQIRDGKYRLFKKDVDGTQTEREVTLVKETMRSVGVLFTSYGGRGTAVRVGSRYVITAWHVVRGIVCPANIQFHHSRMDPSLLDHPDIYVDFHETCRQSPPTTHFRFCPTIPFFDEDLDIAVLELAIDDVNRGHLPAPIDNFADVFSINSRTKDIPCVILIGQHPQKDEKVVDFQCKLITRDDEKVIKARKWIKRNMPALKKMAERSGENPNHIETAVHDVYEVDKYLTFDTYLDFGGSGGAVIAHLPAGGVALVAILTHGLPTFFWYTANKYNIPDIFRMEVGCTLKAIRESPNWKDQKDIKADIFQDETGAMEVDENAPLITVDGCASVPMETCNI